MKNFNNPFEGLDRKMDQHSTRPAEDNQKEELQQKANAQQKTDTDLDEKELLQRKFENIIKDKMYLVPPGFVYEPEIDGINQIYINYRQHDKDHPYLNIEVFYTGKNREGETKVFIDDFDYLNDGTLVDERPGGNKISKILKGFSRNVLKSNVLDALAKINLGKWIVMSHVQSENLRPTKIIPPDARMSTMPGNNDISNFTRKPIDLDRIYYFINHPDVLYGICPSELTRVSYGRGGKLGPQLPLGGLSDYHAFVFPRGLMFENVVCENNLYFHPYDKDAFPGGRIPQDTIDRIKRNKLSLSERNQLLSVIASPRYLEMKKSDLIKLGLRYGERHRDFQSQQNKNAFYNRLDDFIRNNLS